MQYKKSKTNLWVIAGNEVKNLTTYCKYTCSFSVQSAFYYMNVAMLV